MNKIIKYFTLTLLLQLGACTPKPHNCIPVTEYAPIYPDYANVTIPYNIAPLNFMMNEAEGIQAIVKSETDSLIVSGKNKIIFDLDQWKELLRNEKGKSVIVKISALTDGQWKSYQAFSWNIAPEPIDSHLSYRLIEPGYEVWNNIQLCERNLENFDEKVIADNRLTNGNCMNCHIHGKQSGKLSMFHLRGKNGGTILNRDGKLRKLTLKNDSMISAAVYGDFHPSGRFAVFSTNIIIPAFHSQGSKRLEVFDTESDLAIADFDENRMILSPIVQDKNVFETFPTFSADGKWIYYCAAPKVELPDSIQKLKYSLCRISFDAKNQQWGEKADTLWNAQKENGSVCFPKASPDGKYILFTIADYGTFPIWHRETDLFLLDLTTGELRKPDEVNSNRSDTYHSWSSNSRWFVFASKRGDGQYGKPYFAYIDQEGKTSKPFVMPQADPANYLYTFKSYNIPDLSADELPYNATDIKEVFETTEAEAFH